jgi:diguanylate cyclase (GGDEF)-like protein
MATTDAELRSVTSRADLLERVAARLHGGAVPAALALTDLDDLTGLNERHGRESGDRVLAAWERVLDANLPAGAEVVRAGGDEYVVVLPGLTAEDALIVLGEIRQHFTGHPVDGVPGEAPAASVGVAAVPTHGSDAESLIRAAGEALMRAKREGRDRIAIYVEEKMVLKSNYYSRASLDRLARLASATGRTEASLLREALDDLVAKYGDRL